MSLNHNYSIKPFTNVLHVREDDALKAAQDAAKAAGLLALTPAELQAKIDAEVAGLKTKNTELLGKMKDLDKKFEGFDPVKIKEWQERTDADEDVKLITEGKKHLVIEKHTERMRASHKDELAAKDAAILAERERADTYKSSVLDNQIRAALNGLHKGAVEDALLAGRQIFTLDAKGNAVKVDSEGRPELGKDGVTPFGPAEWIESQKKVKTHWFPMGTSGSGSGGTHNASGFGADFSNLSPTERLTAARKANKK